MIYLDISGTNAAIRKQEKLTTGMVGTAVEFRFDRAWEGLTKTAVFRAGDVVKDVFLTDTTAVIPWETLVIPGIPLQIGVYGAADSGSVVIPTVWVSTESICPGADPSGDESMDPSLPVWAQVQQVAEQASVTAVQAEQKMQGVEDALDSILAIQEALIGGEGV